MGAPKKKRRTPLGKCTCGNVKRRGRWYRFCWDRLGIRSVEKLSKRPR